MDNGINSSSSPKVSLGSFTDPSRSSTVSDGDTKINTTVRACIFTPPTERFSLRGRVKLFLKEETFEEVLSHAKNGKVRSTFTFFGPATKKPYTEILAQALCKKARSNEFEDAILQLSAHINAEDGNFGFILKATIQAALKEPTILETLLNTSQTDSESLLNEILDIAKDNPNFRSDLFESDVFSGLFNNKEEFQDKILDIAKDNPNFRSDLFESDVFSGLFNNKEEFQDKILDIAKDNPNFSSDLFESDVFSGLFNNTEEFQDKILDIAKDNPNFSSDLFKSDVFYTTFENNDSFREKVFTTVGDKANTIHDLDVFLTVNRECGWMSEVSIPEGLKMQLNIFNETTNHTTLSEWDLTTSGIVNTIEKNQQFSEYFFSSSDFRALFENNDAFQDKILEIAKSSPGFRAGLFDTHAFRTAFLMKPLQNKPTPFQNKIVNIVRDASCGSDFLHHLDLYIASKNDINLIKTCLRLNLIPKIAILGSPDRSDHIKSLVDKYGRHKKSDQYTPAHIKELEVAIESSLPYSIDSSLVKKYEELKGSDYTLPLARTKIVGQGVEGFVSLQSLHSKTVTKTIKKESLNFQNEVEYLHHLKDCPHTPTLIDFTSGTKGNLTRTYADMIGPEYKFPRANEVRGVTMTRCSGMTLNDYLVLDAKSSSQDKNKNKKVTEALLEAIKSIHKKKVCHRDLHCGNIIIDFDNKGKIKIYIVDFGKAMPISKGQDYQRSNDASQLLTGLELSLESDQSSSGKSDLRMVITQALNKYKAECDASK